MIKVYYNYYITNNDSISLASAQKTENCDRETEKEGSKNCLRVWNQTKQTKLLSAKISK